VSDAPNPEQQADDPMLSPEEETLLDKVWDSIDFDDTAEDEPEDGDDG
jgi:hypothetical protein